MDTNKERTVGSKLGNTGNTSTSLFYIFATATVKYEITQHSKQSTICHLDSHFPLLPGFLDNE